MLLLSTPSFRGEARVISATPRLPLSTTCRSEHNVGSDVSCHTYFCRWLAGVVGEALRGRSFSGDKGITCLEQGGESLQCGDHIKKFGAAHASMMALPGDTETVALPSRLVSLAKLRERRMADVPTQSTLASLAQLRDRQIAGTLHSQLALLAMLGVRLMLGERIILTCSICDPRAFDASKDCCPMKRLLEPCALKQTSSSQTDLSKPLSRPAPPLWRHTNDDAEVSSSSQRVLSRTRSHTPPPSLCSTNDVWKEPSAHRRGSESCSNSRLSRPPASESPASSLRSASMRLADVPVPPGVDD